MQQTSRETDRTVRFLPSLRILSYHSISNLAGTKLANYGVSPDQFEHQINILLQSGYDFIDPTDLIAVLAGHKQIYSESILLTFDDCYSNFLSSAMPILQRYKIKAMVFPVSRLVGGHDIWNTPSGAPKLQLLDAAELLHVQSEGTSIGLHSRTHPRLTELSDSDLIAEIEGAREDLTAMGLKPLPILAYPYGDFNERVKKTAQNCGIEAALTVYPGIVQERGDLFQIPRIEILPTESGPKFLDKVAHLRVAKRSDKADRGRKQHDLREASDVTLVILSCGRYDLLDATVRSFFRINKYPIKEVLIAEDSGDPEALDQLKTIFTPYDQEVTFFIHTKNHGIGECKDILYSRVKTDFIMHLEDDWLCTSMSGDFIQRAKDILSANANILQVWLRPPYDCNGHPLEDKILGSEHARFALLKTGYRGKWHGYSDNPNLRRKREYLLLASGGYSSLTREDSVASEAAIGQFYFERGFRAAVLVEPDAAFIHIGGARAIAIRRRWSTPQSMSELHIELSHAHERNQQLAKDMQHLRERLQIASEELRAALSQSQILSDKVEQLLQSTSWKITRPGRSVVKALKSFARRIITLISSFR
jgi:peptidoglycan/xylan/chitin deacetylase (PgdA/CDA1 family)